MSLAWVNNFVEVTLIFPGAISFKGLESKTAVLDLFKSNEVNGLTP
jgi:hypothetical protein